MELWEAKEYKQATFQVICNTVTVPITLKIIRKTIVLTFTRNFRESINLDTDLVV